MIEKILFIIIYRIKYENISVDDINHLRISFKENDILGQNITFMLKYRYLFSTKVGINMTNKDKVLEIAKKNNGVVLTRQVTEKKIPRTVLINMVNEKSLFPIQRGIYVTADGYVDDFYLLQARFPKGIFSHETALYLQGYSDRVPILPIMTFKYGTSTTRMKGEIRPVIVSADFELGKIEIEKNSSKLVLYDVERTLVDMLKPRYDTDFEQFIPALKLYATSKDKDINKLFTYAQHFGIASEMQKYIGGLL